MTHFITIIAMTIALTGCGQKTETPQGTPVKVTTSTHKPAPYPTKPITGGGVDPSGTGHPRADR